MAGETYNILNNIFSGQTPLKRTNPKAGESEYYYVVPGQKDWSSLNELKTVDVPSASTPNPYLQPQETMMNGITQATNAFNSVSSGIVMGKALDEYNKLYPMPVYDKYKHATVSCIGAQGGLPSAGATALGGLGKEAIDAIKKAYNLYQGVGPYKTYSEIGYDSLRDMQANINGIAQGITHPTANCEDLMQQYYNIHNK